MKHAGKARSAAVKLIGASFILLVVILGAGLLGKILGGIIWAFAVPLVIVWFLFVAFTLYFFRDPSANVPQNQSAIVSPGHGTVDVIDETTVSEFAGEKCKRISIFLNVFNVHVQQAPVTGKVTYLKHTSGLFLNALKTESAEHNENVMITFEPSGKPNDKVGIRLIAGLIARRIIPWVTVGDEVAAGERISLIQFGSRVDVYLPLNYKISTKIGDKVVGGETIIALKE
ncbi:MAG: phosphatidylserine decarboxylase [Verrucomicrobia bacterium]|nr:phosphatidylserine decarboxylase [Verrucomicrobiota bacterium]